MSERVKYHDNIQVRRLKWGYEYLAITFQDPGEDYSPYQVALSCYCVPGRIDSYMFDWVPGGSGFMARIRFCSEGQVNLPKALKMLHDDLDKPQVVELVKQAVSKEELLRYSHIFIGMLADLAPKSKAYRAGYRVLNNVVKARRERLQKERANEQTSQVGISKSSAQCAPGVHRPHPQKRERSNRRRAAA